jgi:membrane protein insertase Oxa1/YidC/SpoIIIJ
MERPRTWIMSVLLAIDNTFLGMNLSQPEWTTLPLIGISIPILAIIVALTTYIQTKVTTPPTGTDPQSKQMSNMMAIYMPLLLGYFAITFASGLAVLWSATCLALHNTLPWARWTGATCSNSPSGAVVHPAKQ